MGKRRIYRGDVEKETASNRWYHDLVELEPFRGQGGLCIGPISDDRIVIVKCPNMST